MKKTLKLNKITLRNIDEPTLERIAGGDTDPATGCFTNPAVDCVTFGPSCNGEYTCDQIPGTDPVECYC